MLEHDVVLLLGLGLTLIHTLGLLSAIHAVGTVRTSQGAIAWAVSPVTFPYLALPLYWVFGRDRFHGYVDALRAEALADADHAIAALPGQLEQVRAQLPGARAAGLEVLARLGGTPCTGGNDLTLLVDGDATFAAIFAAIEAAEHYCLIQFFIVKDDALGRRLQALLVRKAAAGVRVSLLYDEVGSHALPRACTRALAAAGVACSAFHTTRGPRNRFQLNFRNHRRSLRLNFEITAIVADPGFAAQVQAMLEEDFRHARRTGAADLRARSRPFRWAVRAARLLDPIL